MTIKNIEKRYNTRAVLLLVFLFLGVTIVWANFYNGPKLYIPKPSIMYSLSEVNKSKSDMIRFAFTLVNRGKGSLSITRIDPSCTCTNYEIQSKQILQNKSTILTLIIDKKSMSVGKKVYAVIADNSIEKYHKVEIEIVP